KTQKPGKNRVAPRWPSHTLEPRLSSTAAASRMVWLMLLPLRPVAFARKDFKAALQALHKLGFIAAPVEVLAHEHVAHEGHHHAFPARQGAAQALQVDGHDGNVGMARGQDGDAALEAGHLLWLAAG